MLFGNTISALYNNTSGFIDFIHNRKGRDIGEPTGFMGANWKDGSDDYNILKFLPMDLDTLIKVSPYPVERLELDIEGAEYPVFESFSFNHKPREIKVAVHRAYGNKNKEMGRKKLRTIFTSNDYVCEDLDREHIFARLAEH